MYSLPLLTKEGVGGWCIVTIYGYFLVEGSVECKIMCRHRNTIMRNQIFIQNTDESFDTICLPARKSVVDATTEDIVREENPRCEAIGQQNLQVLREEIALEIPQQREKITLKSKLSGIASVAFRLALSLFVVRVFAHHPVANICGGVLLFGAVTFVTRWVNTRSKLSPELQQCADEGDLNSLDGLIKSLDASLLTNDERNRLRTLTPLLRKLTEDTSNRIDAVQQSILLRWMRKNTISADEATNQCLVATLHVLGKFADANALPTVRRLANMDAHTGEQQRLRASALACLPILEARVIHLQTSGTLLRASAPSNAPDMLLRAATSEPQIDTEQLLRAVSAASTRD